jgi:hypothetical protein
VANLKKPQNLSDLHRRLEKVYSGFHQDVKTARSIYRKEFKNLPKLPAGVAIHRPSTGRNLADNLADQIRTDNPLVAFQERSTTHKHLQHKDLMQKWGQYIVDHLNEHTLIDPMEQVKKDLLVDAAACVKYTVNNDLLPKTPKRSDFKSNKAYEDALKEWNLADANTWAWDTRPIDILQVFPAPGRNSNPPFFLEVRKRFAYEVEQDYDGGEDEVGNKRPMWKDTGSDLMRSVTVLEYWDKDHYMMEIEGTTIYDKPNPYGVVPYAWSYNGLGRLDVSGDPRYYGESIFLPILGELEAEVRIKTAQDAQWQFHVFPRLITTLSPAAARSQFMKGPGAIIQIADMTQAPKWLEVQAPNPQMAGFLMEVKGTIAQRFPPQLTQRSPGVDAGIHQALLLGQALKPLLPIKQALNRIATKMLNGMAQQMIALEMKTNVFSTKRDSEKESTVSWRDFTHLNFEVKYEATDPAEDQRKLLTGLALLRVPGLLSRRTFRSTFAEQLKLSNDDEEKWVAVERTLDILASQGLLVEDAMHEVQERVAEEQAGAASAQAGEQIKGSRERGLEDAGAGPQEERPESGRGFDSAGV